MLDLEPNLGLLEQTLVNILVQGKVEEHTVGRNPEQSKVAGLLPSEDTGTSKKKEREQTTSLSEQIPCAQTPK